MGLPKVQQRLIAAEIIPRFGIKPFLKVRFPLWIIRIGLVSDLDMPLDWCLSRFKETNLVGDVLFIGNLTEELPP